MQNPEIYTVSSSLDGHDSGDLILEHNGVKKFTVKREYVQVAYADSMFMVGLPTASGRLPAVLRIDAAYTADEAGCDAVADGFAALGFGILAEPGSSSASDGSGA